MTIEQILSIIGAILGSSLIAAILTYKIAKDKQPIERDSAVVASAEQNVQMSLGLAQHAVNRVESLSGEVERLTNVSRAQDHKIAYLTRVIERWVAFGENLRLNWPTIRQQETPPVLPEVHHDKEYSE